MEIISCLVWLVGAWGMKEFEQQSGKTHLLYYVLGSEVATLLPGGCFNIDG